MSYLKNAARYACLSGFLLAASLTSTGAASALETHADDDNADRMNRQFSSMYGAVLRLGQHPMHEALEDSDLEDDGSTEYLVFRYQQWYPGPVTFETVKAEAWMNHEGGGVSHLSRSIPVWRIHVKTPQLEDVKCDKYRTEGSRTECQFYAGSLPVGNYYILLEPTLPNLLADVEFAASPQ